MILAESPRRQRVTKLVNWGHWYALANIVIAIIISSIYVVSSPAAGTVLGSFYMLANWFGHISFLTFFGFVIFVLPLCYLDVSHKTIKGIASVLSALGLALLAFDALLYNRTGFHLSHSSAHLLKTETHTDLLAFSAQQWLYLLLLFVVWLGFQLVLANGVWKRIDRLIQFKIGRRVVSFFITSFVASHAIHVWADAELYQPIIKQDNMFPLSYPATAKTTMSRYGLLDIERYQQRKQLQFTSDIYQINYPSKPVYCAIDSNKPVVLLVQTDTQDINTAMKMADLRKIEQFFTTSTSLNGLIATTLFGIPELYEQSVQSKQPITLALAHAFDVSAQVYVEQHPHALANYTQIPSATTIDPNTQITIGFVSGNTIAGVLNQFDLSTTVVMVASGYKQTMGTLYTNLAVEATLASNEDLTPTLLNALGCKAEPNSYTTGQDLVDPKREWLVSTSGEKIVVLYDQQRIEVLSNGSYEITNIHNDLRSDEPLNVDLLSRAIKHLTHFAQ